MNKIPFFMLMLLAMATSCTKVEEQAQNKAANLVSPQTETQAPSEAVTTNTDKNVSPTIDKSALSDTKMPINAHSKGKAKEGTIVQQVYQQVEALIAEAALPTDDKETPTYFYEETPIGKYFAQSIKASEILTVTPSLFESVQVIGKEGTIITFPPASLIDEEGKPITSPVEIELKECYHNRDILAANLTTTCSDMTLQTDGMIYLNVTCKGKAARLLPTHPILVEMPTKNKKEDMELFYGEKRPASGVMNWRVADTKKKRKNNIQENLTIGKEVKKDWERIGESTPKYNIGEIELAVNLKETGDLDGKPTVSFQLTNIHPKLEKYKAIITETLNKVVWEKSEEAQVSGKILYTYQQQCLLGGVMFANLADLLKMQEEISKYKNFSFKKTISLQAHLDKNLYYTKKGLGTSYVFDKAAWTQDKKFFENNFERIKGQQGTYFDNLIEELEANKESLLNSYTANYALSYLFTINQMGWINCDRFDTNTGERTDLMVKYDNKKDTDIKLIFAEDRSFLPGRDLGKMVGFTGLPKGKKAVIIATKMMNDIPYFCLQEVTIGQDRNIELRGYRRMTMAELEQEMIRLGIAA